jgi:hypothetical protein
MVGANVNVETRVYPGSGHGVVHPAECVCTVLIRTGGAHRGATSKAGEEV